MHAVNAPSLPAQRCPLMLEMSGSENIPHCPCMAVCLIESSHDPLSSGYAYDSVPPGRAVMERDSVVIDHEHYNRCCTMRDRRNSN